MFHSVICKYQLVSPKVYIRYLFPHITLDMVQQQLDVLVL